MKHIFFFTGFICCSFFTWAQNYEEVFVYKNAADSSFNCYVKYVPKGEIRGVLVRDYSSLPKPNSKSRYKLMELCMQNGLIYLVTNSSPNFPELFIEEQPMRLVDAMVKEVVEEHQVPRQNIFMGGISSSGTRAARFAQYCETGKSSLGIRISGVFLCDSPLDNERFYRSARDIQERNHPKGMNEEAEWMLELYPRLMGGSPREFMKPYIESSVYCSIDREHKGPKSLNNVSFILFHEADMNWWTFERNATYQDINATDHVGFARASKNVGNQDITLIETTGKGFDKEGNRNCHSWTIVDEDLLMKWILDRCK